MRKIDSEQLTINSAIRNELATQKRAEIDAEFAEMADDTEYQLEAEIINQEFAQSDWEALRLGESQNEQR